MAKNYSSRGLQGHKQAIQATQSKPHHYVVLNRYNRMCVAVCDTGEAALHVAVTMNQETPDKYGVFLVDGPMPDKAPDGSEQ